MPSTGLSQAEREALRRVLAAPKLEILPLSGVLPQLAELPAGSTLTVTASPSKGLDASVSFAGRLRAAGFEVIVHLAARMVADRSHLGRLLDNLRDAGVDRAFVIAGDAGSPGGYPDALALLREMADIGHNLAEIGIAAYPQGHARIGDEVLLAALRDKARYAGYMTTQLCFDADALGSWLRQRRSEGLALPVDIGLPGAVEATRLLRVGTRIGVTDTARFVSRQGWLLGRLLRPGGYRPDRLLRGLAPVIADPDAGVRGLHLYTFNQLASTERWRQRFLHRLPD